MMTPCPGNSNRKYNPFCLSAELDYAGALNQLSFQ